jgi:FKBP-type peptidyl-prolyl cis-trans isomerase FklB
MRTVGNVLSVLTVIVLVAGFGVVGCGKAPSAEESKAPVDKAPKSADKVAGDDKVDMGKVSYCIGFNLGKNAKTQDVTLDQAQFSEGLKAGLDGKAGKFNEEDTQKVMTAFQRDMMMKQMAKMKKAGDENKKKGEDFLAENKKKAGVVVTKTGLQYKVVKSGAGRTPKPTDTVTVNYKGSLIDGTEFDSSEKRGKPAVFQANEVIPGWTEALQLMKEGDKWQIVLPSDLAYGEQGASEVIGPNAVLVFDVELLKVEDTPKVEEPPKAPEPPKVDENKTAPK